MKLLDYLSSNLLPRVEKVPDVFSTEPYWALPDSVSVYSKGFNMAKYEDQSKPLITHLEDMNPEKFDLLMKYKNCEVLGVKVFPSDPHQVHLIIHIDPAKEGN